MSALVQDRDEAAAAAEELRWSARVVTIFPEAFPGPLGLSIVGRALDRGMVSLETVDIRDFARDKHRSVDDTPFGGGPGMVMRPDIVADALEAAGAGNARYRALCLSPRGRLMDQAFMHELAAAEGVVLLCGRFEGIDQRVIDAYALEEVSLGDFVLAGGEVAAMALIEAVVRLLPGVAGNADSTREESFETGLLEYPQFTRPQVWRDREVPPVLLSGHHGQIRSWRQEQAETVTRARRADLWSRHVARKQGQR
ncbi:tRNA (guanosine(37)-N1)-methyltransferase TrmD [Oceanibacterium hippocampi]|uniref:tRNA (guanine-N(1)-)-methyltransferase n=1 Tax=Oceanibacterium hippocampi TaxID=745714 RepID=A0A1Y5RCI5_9PROT|nr:tRNA (guanosine(37)-N1)-methyltransferase TrmD [Oceanibacterium hippocampi]SLN14328.1 tRNA (guanine-N(1)-)-methyltransferase [Oceanibacterium hippocampi]